AYPPFFGDRPGPENSLSFIYRNAGKRCLRLDPGTPAGRATLERLAAAADFVVEAGEAGVPAGRGLDPRRLAETRGTVGVAVSQFGLEGPRAGDEGSALVDFARSGSMHLSGMLGEPPCNAPGPLAYDVAGVYAALALLVALRHRQRTGEGQLID